MVATAAKLMSMPAVMGMLAGVLGFMFMWPATKREGFSRLAASSICSHFFGASLLATAVHFLPWIPVTDMAAACYLIVGLPGWWILGWIFKWMQNRRDQDFGEVAHDAFEGAKRVKEIM